MLRRLVQPSSGFKWPLQQSHLILGVLVLIFDLCKVPSHTFFLGSFPTFVFMTGALFIFLSRHFMVVRSVESLARPFYVHLWCLLNLVVRQGSSPLNHKNLFVYMLPYKLPFFPKWVVASDRLNAWWGLGDDIINPPPSPINSNSEEVEKEEPLVDPNKVFQPISALGTARVTQSSNACSWEEMEDDHRNGVRGRHSRWAASILLNEWMLQFKTWTCEQKHKEPNFNNWYAFEILPQHLEHEML